jgi:pyridoxamine 5'-phosphate oxidase
MSSIPNSAAEYSLAVLHRCDLNPDPIQQFDQWFKTAVGLNDPEPNAMTLATVASDGTPSARIVLLKDYTDRGFAFFTNYESQKALELTQNPRAALVFFFSSGRF